MNWTLLFVGACLPFISAFSAQPDGVDYLRLTSESLPHQQVVIQAALEHLKKATGSQTAQDLKRGAFVKALIPQIIARVSWRPNTVPEYEWSRSQNSYKDSGTDGSIDWYRDQERWNQTGYDQGVSEYYVGVYWDLTELVYAKEDRIIVSERRTRASLERRRIVDVNERYISLKALLPDENTEPDPQTIGLIIEHAAVLDYWTGGLIGQAVSRDYLK